jgi:hypothetical protein
MIEVDLNIGIICGDDKRILEEYVDSSNFKQRENYDEYYIVNKNVKLNLDLGWLMILAETFKVTVYADSVCIEDNGA